MVIYTFEVIHGQHIHDRDWKSEKIFSIPNTKMIQFCQLHQLGVYLEKMLYHTKCKMLCCTPTYLFILLRLTCVTICFCLLKYFGILPSFNMKMKDYRNPVANEAFVFGIAAGIYYTLYVLIPFFSSKIQKYTYSFSKYECSIFSS